MTAGHGLRLLSEGAPMTCFSNSLERSMTRYVLALCLLGGLLGSGGCGSSFGEYILTVPDMVAPAGSEGVAVVRLQRNDFFVLAPPVKQAAIRLAVGQERQRGAYTDDLGYAGTTLPVPSTLGRYELKVAHLDRWGDEVIATAKAYVWDPNAPAVAVDLDCLSDLSLGFSKQSLLALGRVAKGANILYLTRRRVSGHAELHKRLLGAGYRDGPILEWRRQHWHIVREGKYNLPRVVVESRLVSQLPDLREMLPGLTMGICRDSLSAKAFAESGMTVVIVGDAGVDAKDVIRRASWSDLAEAGVGS